MIRTEYTSQLHLEQRNVEWQKVLVAWYNLNPVTKLMAEMFVVGSKTIDGKSFSNESEARRWLKTNGIG